MSQTSNRLGHLKTLHYLNIDFGVATAFLNAISKTFVVGFVGYLYGSEFWVNVPIAVPSLMGLLQIPGAIWGSKQPTYKPFVFWGQLFWRFFHIPLIILPFLPLAAFIKLTVLLSCIGIGAIGFHLSGPSLNQWITELVPIHSRGWFFSHRNAIAAFAGALSGIAGGIVLDAMKRAGHQGIGFSIVFGTIIVVALLSLLFYRKMTDLQRPVIENTSFKENFLALKIPLQDINFRKILTYSAVLTAGLSLGGNLFYAFALRSLEMPFTILQLTIVTEALGNILSAKFWGYLSDKYGNKPVLAVLGVGLFISPMMWLICFPGHYISNAVILIIGFIFSGAIWGGTMICHLNLLLATGKPEQRSQTIALGLAIQSIVGAIAPTLGGLFMVQLKEFFTVDIAYKLIFIIAMFLRLSSVYFLKRFHEEKSVSIQTVMEQLRSFSPKGIFAFKQLSSSKNIQKRSEAIADVGSSHLTLVTEEVIQALHDPSPEVRLEATRTLGQIGNKESAFALVDQLEEHADFVEEETLEALGSLKDPDTIPYIAKYLLHSRSSLRRGAAIALGSIGNQKAVPYLIEICKDQHDIDLTTAAIQSLHTLKAKEAKEVIAKALLDPAPSIRISAAHASTELNLTELLSDFRNSLEVYQDEAASEIAYALGCLGQTQDIPFILKQAESSKSIMARRRCILGLATMLGVREKVYSLMLLEGMSLENAILDRIQKKIKRNKKIHSALNSYLSGKENDALQMIAEASKKEELKLFIDSPVNELFLVAISLL